MGTYNLTTKATNNSGISAVLVQASAAPAETYLLGCPIALMGESATIFIEVVAHRSNCSMASVDLVAAGCFWRAKGPLRPINSHINSYGPRRSPPRTALRSTPAPLKN